ncbi:MAG: hypothetical protein ISR59_08925 [Anaerolineales bacterium]|uniref:Uncharacterized protein n=1 Tax=Candidatus Desulfolinea nitratireducens TaxID=2841698 RepID=A0A8J6NI54_9CHLR|nr:hypothetical protein [Candidatus Desulfolinea nitratireducens]MBL6961221.1 hypothetical protein [Anaerolineales bacterium]
MFGKYFYNVNSTFYIWYDSWEDAKKGTRAYGDRIGWPNMPENEIPTARKYFIEHSSRQIIERIKLGIDGQIKNIIYSYSYFNYLLIYLGVLILIVSLNLKRNLKIAMEQIYQILFFLYIFGANLILYAWYSPIASGPRFTYSLYIPFIYTIFLIINNCLKESKWTGNNNQLLLNIHHLFTGVNLTVIGLFLYEILYHIPVVMSSVYFGN